MLGVFKRRWKPKRVASDSIRPAVPESASPEPPDRFARPPPLRQIYPSTEPTQNAYDTTLRRKTKPDKSGGANQNNKGANQSEYSDMSYEHLVNRGAYPMAPNICVEGGRIEFVKTPADGSIGVQTPPGSPLGARSMRNYEEEKFDGDKEALEARIRLLEQRLEAEALSAQKDRLAVARLQHQLSKRTSGSRSDAERARPDAQARLSRAEHEAERANQRLRAAHKEIARMEETVRSLLQYKSRVEALKQEKSSLSTALEARSIHYQQSLSKLSAENESLRNQVTTLQTAASEQAAANLAAAKQAAANKVTSQPIAVQEITQLVNQEQDSSDPQKKQYERCLDDVANQVVRALLSQKGLREELSRLGARARELEAQNRSLGALLLRQLRPRAAPSPASPDPAQELQIGVSSCCNSAAISSLNSSEFASCAENILSNKVNYQSELSTRERFVQKNNRLYKSNDDINATTDNAGKHYSNDNKRFSAGNIIVPSCGNRLCSANSIISFKDEPIGDLMNVCVAHHTYQLSAEDKRRHQILTELWTELKGIEVTPQSLLQALRAVDPALWAPPERPLTLNLKVPPPAVLSHCFHRLSQTLPDHLPLPSTEDEVTVESPESGNRDEGYSTMSSDVQADPCRQGEPNRELEDLKEASDETENQVLLNINNAIIVDDKTDQEILYIPLNFAVSFNPRNSYPPTKSINPFQHIMRSFSDSNLCLKLTTSATQCGENCFTFSSPSSPSMILLDVMPILQREKKNHPLRRTRGTASLVSPPTVGIDNAETNPHSRNSWVSNIDEQVDGCQYDAEYVQHWLQLDDTRSALQQQHRDLLDLEYDQAEMEDWSLNLSCEDLQENNWKRNSMQSDAITPGQISLSTLPSIQENNTLELEEDVSECLWNNSSYMLDTTSDKFAPLSLENDTESHKRDENHWPYPPMENSGLPSPGGSWSSIENSEDCCINNECFYNNDNLVDNDTSKRSSAAMSGYSDEPESSAVGTDFTRDFYRLVKFESTKSLASNSSRGLGAGGGQESGQILKLPDIQITLKQEREQALQNVLNFIAEQQKYCHNREELDSLPSRPISEIRELPPPYIDCQDFNTDTDESMKHLNEIKYTEGSCRDSLASEIIYSENESCDIILSNDFNSMYSDMSPDLTKVPRIIDNQNEEFYSDSEGFVNGRDFHDTDNEIDEQHLLKVHQKNEINKNNDASLQVSSLANATSSLSEVQDIAQSLTNVASDLSSASAHGSQGPNTGGPESTSDKNSPQNDFILNPNDSECSLLEEVLNACKRGSGSLVTVLEEEEAGMENSLTQTSDSMTTSVSTSDTVATEICKTKKKTISDKSRIPVAAGSAFRKQSQIPIKAKSKLPIPESSKSIAQADLNGECSFKECKISPGSIIVSQGPSHSRIVSFHEAATSKDVIDELNRMIRKGEDGVGSSDNEAPAGQASNLDKALWCPTGWVHVEREIDFSDPKARANLLDVMLASSDSSPSPTSSCAGSFSSDSGDERANYSRLHHLHRHRRQKKAAALRERGLAVLRFSCFHRPTIIGRNDFFVRYGKEEREAVACFDFLEDISSAVNFVTSIEESSTSILENQISQDSGKVSQRSIDFCHKHGTDSDNSSRETLSDSCAASFSGSEISLEDNSPYEQN